jgi:glycerol-3-phosphate acyltransferase PlsY
VRAPPTVVVASGYLAGAVPFSNLVARRTRGVDLRDVGTGTVSGTALYRVAGFAPLACGGVLDVAKGAVGPLLAGRDRPVLAAVAAGAAVAGHNWSVFLDGAGGRGISPAMGGLLATAWPGTVVLAAGLAGGRLARHTALGSLVAYVVLVPLLARSRGATGAAAGAAVVVPLLVKRVTGNGPPPVPRRPRWWWSRLLYDRDPR